ncbi:MAG: single-stranded DNA-binding protein [Synergistaceae bacterium]|nr:single-stranded DNA-binding protein [Synergistota bacterium]NLM72323.1 single-stranded DNA-binding protein [Synergistaceae bacterium]
MARGYNKVVIVGNLARDPEVRYTASKQAVANFAVAVNRAWKDRNGELQESVDFIPVVVWGPMAENCERYLKKGNQALVEGRLQVRSYEAKDGSGKRYVTEVIASDVVFLGGPRKRDDSPGGFEDEGFGGSVRRDRRFSGQDDDFPMDISSVQDEEEEDEEDVNIPF